MKVILTTNIKKLGKIGELVDVKVGYARNFLFPNKMALRENAKNLEYFQKIKEEIKINENKKVEEAKKTIEKIKNLKFEFNKEADEKDQLYGSITKKEIISFLKKNEINIH
jgi:ribosomal protein L9